jgi:tryptophan 2,3-dioxygenase
LSPEGETNVKLSEPVLAGEGGSDYERYLRTDALLALQKGPAEWAHRDELLFQTVHQSSELWLKLASVELEEASRLVSGGELSDALRLLRRALDCLKIVTGALDALEHISPWDYQEVRKVLGHGSGFDSPGFRSLARVVPRLGSAFDGARESEGLSLAGLYIAARAHEELYQLAESLIELDERIVVWRVRHFVVVERIIGGAVVGTQGTPVEVLGRLIHKRFFPELWQVRNELTALSQSQQ